MDNIDKTKVRNEMRKEGEEERANYLTVYESFLDLYNLLHLQVEMLIQWHFSF